MKTKKLRQKNVVNNSDFLFGGFAYYFNTEFAPLMLPNINTWRGLQDYIEDKTKAMSVRNALIKARSNYLEDTYNASNN
jgi:hypothetical protein